MSYHSAHEEAERTVEEARAASEAAPEGVAEAAPGRAPEDAIGGGELLHEVREYADPAVPGREPLQIDVEGADEDATIPGLHEVGIPDDLRAEIEEIVARYPEVRSASIISKGRSVVKRFPGGKLSEVIEKHPEVVKEMKKNVLNIIQNIRQSGRFPSGGRGRHINRIIAAISRRKSPSTS